MNESEETENDLSFNFLDFVDHELEDTVTDENSTNFVDLEFISDQENEPENFNQSVIFYESRLDLTLNRFIRIIYGARLPLTKLLMIAFQLEGKES